MNRKRGPSRASGLSPALQVRGGLIGSLAAHKIPVIDAKATVEAPGLLRLEPTPTSPANLPKQLRAKNIILAPGSTPFIPPGIEMPAASQPQAEGPLYEQQQQIMTSDSAVGLPVMPSYLTIIGAGYIGMEFAEVFSAMGAEVTLIEAGDRLLPGVDPAIAQAAERILLQRDSERPIKLITKTLAASVKRTRPISAHSSPQPLEVQLKDAETGEPKGVLFPDACLVATGRRPASQVSSIMHVRLQVIPSVFNFRNGQVGVGVSGHRQTPLVNNLSFAAPSLQGLGLEALGVQLKRGGFVPVDSCMRVVKTSVAAGSQSAKEEPIDGLYCIGDANGLMQLAHAASAQAATAVEAIVGRTRPFNHRLIPAACFTNPEIAFVGRLKAHALLRLLGGSAPPPHTHLQTADRGIIVRSTYDDELFFAGV